MKSLPAAGIFREKKNLKKALRRLTSACAGPFVHSGAC